MEFFVLVLQLLIRLKLFQNVKVKEITCLQSVLVTFLIPLSLSLFSMFMQSMKFFAFGSHFSFVFVAIFLDDFSVFKVDTFSLP